MQSELLRMRNCEPSDNILDPAIKRYYQGEATAQDCQTIADYLKRHIEHGKGIARTMAEKELDNLICLTGKTY